MSKQKPNAATLKEDNAKLRRELREALAKQAEQERITIDYVKRLHAAEARASHFEAALREIRKEIAAGDAQEASRYVGVAAIESIIDAALSEGTK